MADSVYYHLERMLPELEDLKERNLFSEPELKEIARRRREFEFRLERRSKVKEDFLSYIEYELQLEKLRLLRKRALVRELHSSKRRWQPSLCDRASAMRVMLIYERASTRFKGDLDLWMQYLEYCKSQGTRRMQKVLTKVLRLHPMVPDVWIYASAWEFGHNANITAARALMQRGLRMCSDSDQLWLEYLQMELAYTERLKANTSSTSVSKMGLKNNVDGSGNEDVDLVLQLDAGDRDELGKVNMALVENPAGIDSSSLDEIAYKLASTIYKNAVTSLPSNLGLRRKFIEILQKFNFSQASSLQDEIFSSVERDFSLDSASWDWQARFRFQVRGDAQIAVQVYERALDVLSSAEMYELYAQFLKQLLGLERQKGKNLCRNPKQTNEGRVVVARYLLTLYDKAKKAGIISSGLAEGHARLLLRLGKLDEAKLLLENLCVSQLRDCARLWAMKIKIEMTSESAAEEKIASLFRQSLEHVSSAEAGELWTLMLEYCGTQVAIRKHIIDIMLNKLASSAGDESSAMLACSLVDWILWSQDMKHARSLYDRILAFPCTNVLFHKHCIDMECRMATAGCKDAPNIVRRLFEHALSKHSQNAGLWLDYWSLEMKAGNLHAAGNIYWRAKKIPGSPSGLIEENQCLLAKEGK